MSTLPRRSKQVTPQPKVALSGGFYAEIHYFGETREKKSGRGFSYGQEGRTLGEYWHRYEIGGLNSLKAPLALIG
jgi:hypothetical protein